MRISDWSSDVCSSDLNIGGAEHVFGFSHHPRETVECRKVRRNGDCFASFTSDGIYCAVQLLLPTRDDHHATAIAPEALGNSPANAVRPARYDSDLARDS